jgi:hypothetical protein
MGCSLLVNSGCFSTWPLEGLSLAVTRGASSKGSSSYSSQEYMDKLISVGLQLASLNNMCKMLTTLLQLLSSKHCGVYGPGQ